VLTQALYVQKLKKYNMYLFSALHPFVFQFAYSFIRLAACDGDDDLIAQSVDLAFFLWSAMLSK
jgi:hypothetical protein